jgi:ribonuclease D
MNAGKTKRKFLVYEWIETPAALDAWTTAQPHSSVIGLDTEFMRTDTFRPKLALIQANIGDHIALLDAPRLGAHSALAARLTAPDCVCVMHSASEDLETLISIVPNGPTILFDTQIAAAMAGLGAGLSYQKLVSLMLGIDVPKAETRSDWLQRPLSVAQLEYAAQDVEYLPLLHAQLAERLASLRRTEWLAEDCRKLVDKICHFEPDMQPQRAFRGASEWTPERQALLRRVLLWREASARALDKPRPWILDDARALNFVAQPPVDANDLFERSKGLRALRSAQRQELFDILKSPVRADELNIAPIAPALSGTEKRVLTAMRDDVAEIARQHDLPEGLLCPRRHLDSLVTDRAWPTALEGWRKPLLHDALMARLSTLNA